MNESNFEYWKQEVINYLKIEIDKKLLDTILAGDITITNRPGSIIRFGGEEITERPDENVVYALKPFLTESIEPFHLRRLYHTSFRNWFDDDIDYKRYLRRFATYISEVLNKYMVQTLCEEAQIFTIEKESITFNYIISKLNELRYYPDVMLLNTLKYWGFIRDGLLNRKEGELNISEYGEIKIYDTRLLSESEVLLLKKEDIMMQKNTMSFNFYPESRPRELYVDEKRVIWAFENRGLGFLH